MTTVVDLPFLLVAALTVLALRIPVLGAWSVEVLAAASLVFVASVTDSAGDAICLAAMAATGWVLMQMVARRKSGLLLAFGIACVVAEFFLARQVLPHAPAPAWLAVGRTIGLSYVMFRVLHLVVDAHGDELPPRTRLRDYVCYLFCYLTFLAGPIQRFQEFAEDAARPIRTTLRQATVAGAPAIVMGYFNFTVVAAAFYTAFAWSQVTTPEVPPPIADAIGWLSFAGYLYASFAGYTDIVRGVGKLIGFELPANFAAPFAATNFVDFWSRWHISLSEWFKLYVFNPAVKAMIAATGRPALVPYLGAVGYFITFFLMGLWHGVGLRFVLYGICLGTGVSVNKLYQYAMLRRFGRARLAAVTRHRLYAAGARALAVGYFILALGFLWISAESLEAGSLIGWTEGAGLVIAIVLILAIAAPPVRDVMATPRLTLPTGPRARIAIAAIQSAIVLAYLLLLQLPAPPLLYQFF